MATKKQLAETLATVPLFERCTKRDLRTIARHLEVVTVAAETEICTEGEPGETFYLVLAGRLAVAEDERQTAVLQPGDHFGELALLDPAPRSASVTTMTETELAALSVRMFKVLLRDMPQISSALLGSLAEQLRQARRNGRDA